MNYVSKNRNTRGKRDNPIESLKARIQDAQSKQNISFSFPAESKTDPISRIDELIQRAINLEPISYPLSEIYAKIDKARVLSSGPPETLNNINHPIESLREVIDTEIDRLGGIKNPVGRNTSTTRKSNQRLEQKIGRRVLDLVESKPLPAYKRRKAVELLIQAGQEPTERQLDKLFELLI